MNFNLSTATRLGLNILVMLGGIVALRLGEGIFIPLTIALLFATILWSSANRLHTFYRFPWAVACIVSVLVLVLVNLVVTFGFVLAVPRLVQDMTPIDPARQQEIYNSLRLRAASVVPLDDRYFPKEAKDSEFFKVVQRVLDGSYIGETVLKLGGYVLNWLWQFILILFILLFLLLEGRMLTRRVTEIFGPSKEVQSKVGEALTEMTHAVRAYLVSRTLVNIGLGIVIGVCYQMMGLRQAWTWALLTGVLCYIPYIGPIIAGIPPLLDAFVHGSPLLALGVLTFYVSVVTLEGYVIVPVIMGRHMDLNATTVMLACLFWELVWGVPGLFLAMPLMAAVKSICDHVPGWKPWANLMSARDEMDRPIRSESDKSVAVRANGAASYKG
ncbi:MAG: AI-2E family transporter [Gemmataceae bacterium]